MSNNPNNVYFAGDGEMLVDRLVAASQDHKQEKPQLPGFGRDLVPYFVPGADEWDENNLNYSGTDGAAQPPSMAPERPSSAGSGRGKKNKKGGGSSPERIDLRPMAQQQHSGKKNKGGKLSSSPPMPTFTTDPTRDRAVQDAFAAAAAASRKPKAAPDSAQKNKGGAAAQGPRFAGPAFSNSPTPESLPIPSFILSAAPEPSPATEIKRMLQMEPRSGSPCVPAESATNSLKALLQLNNGIAC